MRYSFPPLERVLDRRHIVQCCLRFLAVALLTWAVTYACYSAVTLMIYMNNPDWAQYYINQGYLTTISTYVALIAAIAAPGLFIRWYGEQITKWIVPLPRMSCPECGHRLQDVPDPRCPECGLKLPLGTFDHHAVPAEVDGREESESI